MDFGFLKEGFNKFLGGAERVIKKYTPESLSEDKQFVNGLVASLALIVVADRSASEGEILKVAEIINNNSLIKSMDMSRDAMELFEIHISSLLEAKDDARFMLQISKLLDGIALVKKGDFIFEIKRFVEEVAMIDGVNQHEIEMKEKIFSKLSV